MFKTNGITSSCTQIHGRSTMVAGAAIIFNYRASTENTVRALQMLLKVRVSIPVYI
jgi:hypothetical protein